MLELMLSNGDAAMIIMARKNFSVRVKECARNR